MTPNDPFAVAELLAPVPDEHATAEDWVRHYAAQSFAAWAQFRLDLRRPAAERAVDLGYLAMLGTASLHAAVAMDSPAWTAQQVYSLTPEAGAFNGEWEEWVVAKLDELGINPADINDQHTAADFRSPSHAEAAATR